MPQREIPPWRDFASWLVRVIRVVVGAFGLFVVVRQAQVSVGDLGFPASHFFSYFTILSNILADTVLIVYGLLPAVARRGDILRGATTLYIAITGVLYNALLRGVDVATTDWWLNEVLHVVIPLALVIDWLVVVQVRPVTRRQSLTWLAIPLAYLAYSLIRGAIVDWYPYPFVDPRHSGGYWRIAAYGVVLAVAMAALSVGVAEIGRRLSTTSLPA